MSQAVASFFEPLRDPTLQDKIPVESNEFYTVMLDPLTSLTLIEEPDLMNGQLRDLGKAKTNLIKELADFWKKSLEERSEWLFTEEFRILVAGAYLDSVILSRLIDLVQGKIGSVEEVNLPSLQNLIYAIDSSNIDVSDETFEEWEKSGKLDEDWGEYILLSRSSLFLANFIFNLYARMRGYACLAREVITGSSTRMGFYLNNDIIDGRLIIWKIRGDYDSLAMIPEEARKPSDRTNLRNILDQHVGYAACNFVVGFKNTKENEKRAILPIMIITGSRALIPIPHDFSVLSTYDPSKNRWFNSLQMRVSVT